MISNKKYRYAFSIHIADFLCSTYLMDRPYFSISAIWSTIMDQEVSKKGLRGNITKPMHLSPIRKLNIFQVFRVDNCA